MMDNISNNKNNRNPWRVLYITGGVAILLAVIVFRRNWSAEMKVSNGFGIFPMPETLPTSALEWFSLLQEHLFVGLSLLDFFDLINYALVGLLFLALYVALRKANQSLMLIAITSGLVGVTVYLASNQALEILSLSKQFAAATSDAQRATLLTAGDTILATHPSDPAFLPTGLQISLFLVLVAGLLISIVMLQSKIFSKATTVCGLCANGLALIGMISLPFLPEIYLIFPTVSAPFRMIWYILIAIQLFKLSNSTPIKETL
ncbi:MAG: DUF4386 family protein [Anaerolineales bacterium]|jgi:hypothetical protein